MSAATNQEAKTIHRTIGLGTTPSGEPTNILDTDIVIVDEIDNMLIDEYSKKSHFSKTKSFLEKYYKYYGAIIKI